MFLWGFRSFYGWSTTFNVLFNSAGSCCWIQTRNSVSSWILMTTIDLGVRSDTKKPNMAPGIAILPFIRYICADVVKLVQLVKPVCLENDSALIENPDTSWLWLTQLMCYREKNIMFIWQEIVFCLLFIDFPLISVNAFLKGASKLSTTLRADGLRPWRRSSSV